MLVWLQRTLVVGFALLAAGCARESSGPRTVLFIVLDTLRADHLGCYGYESASTPHLDALAARGVRFTDAMTVAPITQPAVTTLLTGQLPFRHGVRDNQGFVLDGAAVTLPERLHDAGWRTGAVLASAVLNADRGLDQGFEVYDDDFAEPYPVYQRSMQPLARGLAKTARRATEVTDRALELLEEFRSDRRFLMVHYFDAHHPYDPPPEFSALHPDSYYDGEISYVDHEVGRLLEAVDPAETLIVVVADHGEGLEDHDEGAHGFYLYQSTLHVPWIVAGPSVPVGLERDDLVSLVDLEPTLAAFLELNARSDRDGRALQWASPAPGSVQYAETFRTLVTYDWQELRALRDGPHKLIIGRDRVELYDLDRDPRELNDVSGLPVTEGVRMSLQSMIAGDDPERVKMLAEEPADSDRAELLESLGYLASTGESVDPVRRRHPLDAVPEWNERQRRRSELRTAMALVEDGAFERGIDILDGVLEADAENVTALYYRGLAREAVGSAEDGRRDLARAERIDPTFVPLQLELAAREEESGEVERARSRLAALRQRDPRNVEVMRFMVDSYLRSNESRRAADELSDWVLVDPTDVRARLELADLLMSLGEAEQARLHFEEVLVQRPDHPRADEIGVLLDTP